MNLNEVQREMLRLSRLVDEGVRQLREQVHVYADAERDYRKANAEAWVRCPRRHDDGEKVTVPEREAWVQAETAHFRHRRDVADGMRQAALEALRSRRQQLSALQSLLAAHREEAGLGRYGPSGEPA